MKKWLLPILIIIMLMWATPLVANTSALVTVTATGYVCGGPVGFTVTYISDYEIGLDWAKGSDAENTIIRAAYGRYPDSPTDGYLVYYGDGTTCSDTAVNLDETAGQVYYRAWSENAGGIINPYEYGEGEAEGIGMTLLGFIILAIGLTVGGFAIKNRAIVFGGAGAWAVLGVFCYTRSTAEWDIYYSLFFLCIALVIVCSLEPVIMREKKTDTADVYMEDFDESDEELMRDMEKAKKERERFDYIFGKPRRRQRSLPLTRYARTGEH